MLKASFKHFMTGLIDYAGCFPPAGLDIETAAANYFDYLAGEDGWMLGRCIVPAAQLHRVGLHPGFRCSVLMSATVPQAELDQLRTFKGHVAMVETRLPDKVSSPDQCADYLGQFKTGLQRAGLQEVQLFVEAGSVAPVAAAAAAFNSRRSGENVIERVGYKLRCGGLVKEAFPSPGRVAEVIDICRQDDLPVKFTAGIHHPLRHYSPGIEVMQHGFINIFATALLGWACNLSTSEMTECLGDGNAHHFRFTDEGFSWLGKTISVSEVKRLRQSRVISFGSCSFTEPLEGLRSLGLLNHSGA